MAKNIEILVMGNELEIGGMHWIPISVMRTVRDYQAFLNGFANRLTARETG